MVSTMGSVLSMIAPSCGSDPLDEDLSIGAPDSSQTCGPQREHALGCA